MEENKTVMNKFNKTLERQIEQRADKKYTDFWKEFEQFLNKHNMPRDVIFKGLMGCYKKTDDKDSNEWSNRVKEIFVANETQNFIFELTRLENYFKGSNGY